MSDKVLHVNLLPAELVLPVILKSLLSSKNATNQDALRVSKKAEVNL